MMIVKMVFSCLRVFVFLCTMIFSIPAMPLHYGLYDRLSYTVGPYSTILIGHSSIGLSVDQYGFAELTEGH